MKWNVLPWAASLSSHIVPTHHLHQAARNRQSEAGAAIFSRRGGIRLREGLENQFSFLRGNGDSRVRDGKMQRGAPALHTSESDTHGDTTVVREFEKVAD